MTPPLHAFAIFATIWFVKVNFESRVSPKCLFTPLLNYNIVVEKKEAGALVD